jgi:hypothetical protein
MSARELCAEFLVGFLFSIAVETPVLLVGLSARHTWRRRLFAGVWLTGCTYPVVFFVLPAFFRSRTSYLFVAETLAPAAECVLFTVLFAGLERAGTKSLVRDWAAIALANLASFALGEILLPTFLT